MQLYIKIIPVIAGTSRPAGDTLLMPCPHDVEPDTVLSLLTQCFGEPIETAWTSAARHEHLATGWIFLSRQATASDPEIELLCVPHIWTAEGNAAEHVRAPGRPAARTQAARCRRRSRQSCGPEGTAPRLSSISPH